MGALLAVITRLHIPSGTNKICPMWPSSPLAALLLCVLCVELGEGEPVLVGIVYHLLASVFFLACLLLLLVRTHPERSQQVAYAPPTVAKTLLVLFLSYRFTVNGGGGVIMSVTGALCMASCLFSLYFFDFMFHPSPPQATVQGAVKVSSILKGALRRAAVMDILAGACSSCIICIIAVGVQSQLLAWIGMMGVYAFFASIVLRVSNDWASIASAVTLIGCLTIFTGMQLERVFDGGLSMMPAGVPLELLGRALEREYVHSLVDQVRSSILLE